MRIWESEERGDGIKRGTYIEDTGGNELSAGERKVDGLEVAVAGEEVVGAHVRVLCKGMEAAR